MGFSLLCLQKQSTSTMHFLTVSTDLVFFLFFWFGFFFGRDGGGRNVVKSNQVVSLTNYREELLRAVEAICFSVLDGEL